MDPEHQVVKSSRLPAKITAYLVSIGWLLCSAFLYRVFKLKIPGLAAYFDNSVVYFKTFWQPRDQQNLRTVCPLDKLKCNFFFQALNKIRI